MTYITARHTLSGYKGSIGDNIRMYRGYAISIALCLDVEAEENTNQVKKCWQSHLISTFLVP